MSILDRFKKEVKCESCGAILTKGKLNGFDSTFRGKRHEGVKLKLCKSCFLEKLQESIYNFNGRTVAYKPIKKENAYHFYKFDQKLIDGEVFYESEIFPPIVSYKLLPSETQICIHCEKTAQFTWCESEENIDTYNVNEVINNEIKTEYLCKTCFANRLIDTIIREDIVLYEFMPPVDNNGILISGEV